MEDFTSGCNLKGIFLRHYEANRKRTLELISKLEQTRSLGAIDVSIMVTEKFPPILGRLKWKEKKFIDSYDIEIDQDYSLNQLREKTVEWKFDYSYPLSQYTNFLDYVINQGTAILEILESRATSPPSTAFPEDTYSSSFARKTLARKDQEFSELWKKLSSYKPIYPDILRSLADQKRGRALTNIDEANIQGLKEALEKTIKKCKTLQEVIRD